MIAKQKIWEVHEYNKEKAGCFAAELGISPLVTGILLERGFNDAEAMSSFLYGSSTPFHDPFLLKDMERTVARIEQAMAQGEQITVYGDYDVDGITASSLLYVYLRGRGAKVNTYIPKRKSEGYGLNDEALKIIAESGTTLVITVDCGISGYHEVAGAPEALDIIITDHHTVPEQLPPAYAIVNPKQKDCLYPFKELSGVGVAFKLCQALEQGAAGKLPKWEQLTELAALGTVADIVPLLGENREIVRRGLKAMATTKLVGLRALIEASGCEPAAITAENIGFGLAPRLNAVGRLEHAQSAVELLVTEDYAKAKEIAAELNRENALRQEISRSIMEEAEAMLAQEEHIDTAIVLVSEGWHQGVIGIVASRLVDKYHLPTILLSLNDGMAKGSCRSIPALNLYEAIAAEKDILTQFGGHHQAAGLTLPADKVAEFKSRFRAYVAGALKPEDYLPRQSVDCVIGGQGQITVRDLQELELLEPCGCSNPSPVFAFRDALLYNQRAMGKDRNHLQFTVDKGDFSYRGVMWNNACLLPFLFDNMIADVAFLPKINTWNNEVSVQLHAVSLRQQLAVGDFRQSVDDKYRLLAACARTHRHMVAFVGGSSSLLKGDEALPASCRPYVSLRSYKELVLDDNVEAVALLELPPCSLRKVVGALQAQGCERLLLLYKPADEAESLAALRVTNPDRDALAAVYQRLMQLLKQQPAIAVADFLRQNPWIGLNALKIMAQLDFITGVDNGIIKKGIIRRRSLEESPLFVELRQERQQLEGLLRDNMRLGQRDLLRG